MKFLNIAMYKFVNLQGKRLPKLQSDLKKKCLDLELKGSIIVSQEGINAMLSGEPEMINQFKIWLALRPSFADLDFKESYSDYKPFNRMLVKIKPELIPFGASGIQPMDYTAPYISAKELKKMLDNNDDFNLLDTRNSYETRLGSFEKAAKLPIDIFRVFPHSLSYLKDMDKTKPTVTYCTGGIRCEKASAYLLKSGFSEVYQLQGGILRYFEECGSPHYEGECFVYDQRVSLDAKLKETQTAQCFNCSLPVKVEEQEMESYVPGISCPHCINGKPAKAHSIDPS